MTRPIVAISLAVVIAGGGLTTVSSGRSDAIAPLTAATITGSDACDLLPDDDLLRVTEAADVASRTPGPPPGLDAGCTWELGPVEDGLAAWSIFMGVLSAGGRAWFDLYGGDVGGEPIAGIGDAALEDGGSGVVAVKGDTFVMVTVIGPGGDAPADTDVARQLAWRLMSRVDAAPVPSATPVPSAMPRSAVRDLVIRMRAPEFGDDNVDAAVTILARSGIGTFAEPTAGEPMVTITSPASPVRLLLHQVRAMALEAWAGGGFPADAIDALAPAESDSASGSEVLAAYVASGSTEGAEAARALMGEIEPAHVADLLFPQLVATLFLSDLVRGSAPEAVASMSRSGPFAMVYGLGVDPRTALATGTCAEVTDFLHGVFDSVLEALAQERPGGPVDTIALEVWGTVHVFASESGRRIVLDVGQPDLELFARVAAAVGLASFAVSFVRPWTLSVTAEPPITVKGIGGPGEPGAFVLRVDTGGADEWPEAVEACAEEAGLELPELGPEGSPVTWSAVVQAPDGLVTSSTGTAQLDGDGTARLDFMTLSDDVVMPWEERIGQIRVSVAVERPGLESLARVARVGITTPSTGERVLREQLDPTVQRVRDSLLQLVAVGSEGGGLVVYHVPAPTPSPPPTGSPAPTATAPPRAVMVRLDRRQMGAAAAGTVLELYSCTGPYGHWSGVIRFGGIDAGVGLAVPWSDLAVEFRLRGRGGVQRAFTTVSGVIPSNRPEITYDIDAFLDFTVDGRTMEVGSRVNVSEQVEGMNLMGTSEPGERLSLPIEPAPAGACP